MLFIFVRIDYISRKVMKILVFFSWFFIRYYVFFESCLSRVESVKNIEKGSLVKVWEVEDEEYELGDNCRYIRSKCKIWYLFVCSVVERCFYYYGWIRKQGFFVKGK